jgi:hypothetical protein
LAAPFTGIFQECFYALIAITKVVFDKIESLKPWGDILARDDIPKTYEWRSIRLPNLLFNLHPQQIDEEDAESENQS